MKESVVLFDVVASPPPPAADVYEVRVLSEAGCEAAHVVGIPSVLDFTYEGRDRLIVHGPRSYSHHSRPTGRREFDPRNGPDPPSGPTGRAVDSAGQLGAARPAICGLARPCRQSAPT